jgi:hypothetical protein
MNSMSLRFQRQFVRIYIDVDLNVDLSCCKEMCNQIVKITSDALPILLNTEAINPRRGSFEG